MANIPTSQIPNVQSALGNAPLAPAPPRIAAPDLNRFPVLGREAFDGVGAGMIGLSRGMWEGSKLIGDFATKMSALNDQAQIANADKLMAEAIAGHTAERMTLPESEWAKNWNEKYRPKLDEAVNAMTMTTDGRAKLLNWYTGKQAAMSADITVSSQKNYIQRSLDAVQSRVDRAKTDRNPEEAYAAIEGLRGLVSDEQLQKMEADVYEWEKAETTRELWETIDTQMVQRLADGTAAENEEVTADLQQAVESGSFESKFFPALNGNQADIKKALKIWQERSRDSSIGKYNEAVTGIAEGQYGTVDELRADWGDKLDALNMQKLEATFGQSPQQQEELKKQIPNIRKSLELYNAEFDPEFKEFDRLRAWIHTMPAGYQVDLMDTLQQKRRDAQPKQSVVIEDIIDRTRQMFDEGKYGPTDTDDNWRKARAKQAAEVDKLKSWARANPKEAEDSFKAVEQYNKIRVQEDQISRDDQDSDQRALKPSDIMNDPRFNRRRDPRMRYQQRTLPDGSVDYMAPLQEEADQMLDGNMLPLPDGTWNVTPKTRDQIKMPSKEGQRQVSLDFNSGKSTSRGVEIVIPYNATKQERAAAQAYVDRMVQFYRAKGIEVPKGRVLTKTGAGENVSRFHTEPFYVQDADAMAAVQNDPDGYAAILEDTLGRLSGVTFIAPHKTKDGGAQNETINEREFARSYIIPALQRRKGSGESMVARGNE